MPARPTSSRAPAAASDRQVCLKRRALLALGVAALPLAALAQAARPRSVAMLSLRDAEPYWASFRDAMESLGYAEGGQVRVALRSAQGKADVLDRLAADLVRANVDIIVAHETPALAAASKATSSVPIVMAAAERLPGGNVTGIAANGTALAGKMLDFIREARARMRRIAVLAERNDPFTKGFVAQLQDAAGRMRLGLGVALVADAGQIERSFAEWEKLRVQAVVVQPGLPRNRVIELASRYGMPTVSPSRAFVEAGGLMSYTHSPADIGRQAAGFVDRLLRGARPGQLPAERATVFELALNLKTATAMALELPDSLLARADVIVQ